MKFYYWSFFDTKLKTIKLPPNFETESWLMTFLAMIGLFIILKHFVIPPLSTLYKHLLRSRKDLKDRYGGNWALVTGATDGIGEAICYELAKEGFNIVLMARNSDKLNIISTKIKIEYKVQT